MKIVLNNGTELHPILVFGDSRITNGATRDTLSFVFSQEASLDELDGIFTEANCETIKLYEGETEHIHSGYTIRAGLSRVPVVVEPATENTSEVIENRVTVSMAQRTYAETQLANLVKQSELHEECIVELANAVYA